MRKVRRSVKPPEIVGVVRRGTLWWVCLPSGVTRGPFGDMEEALEAWREELQRKPPRT
jgi:hypothetical protein